MNPIKFISGKLIILAIIALFTSCEDWSLKGIRGEGPVVSEDVEVAVVNGIILEIPATVYLERGDVQSVRIDAQQNILDNIINSTDNGLLKLRFDEDVSRSEPIKVYMTINSLKGIDVRGSGEVISSTEFNSAENLYINISGSGNVFAEANAQEVDMNISGSGDIELKTVCERLYSNISGSGDVRLDGSANYAEFSTSGSGNIEAFNFNIETCKVNIVGSGGAKLNVLQALTINITGSGDVHYKGTPTLSVNIIGTGEIINAN